MLERGKNGLDAGMYILTNSPSYRNRSSFSPQPKKCTISYLCNTLKISQDILISALLALGIAANVAVFSGEKAAKRPSFFGDIFGDIFGGEKVKRPSFFGGEKAKRPSFFGGEKAKRSDEYKGMPQVFRSHPWIWIATLRVLRLSIVLVPSTSFSLTLRRRCSISWLLCCLSKYSTLTYLA